MKKTLFMETTKIDPAVTVAQIQAVLGIYGAGAIMTEYDKGQVVGVCFKISVNGKVIPFRLPCRWEAVKISLYGRRKKGVQQEKRHEAIEAQAKRVAWRQILRWVEAQMALVETNMVKIQEVFMPYVQVSLSGQTLYEKIEETKFKVIEHQDDRKKGSQS